MSSFRTECLRAVLEWFPGFSRAMMVAGHLSSPAQGAGCACTMGLAPYRTCFYSIKHSLGFDYVEQSAQPGVALHACFANSAGSVPRRVWVCNLDLQLPATQHPHCCLQC